ncbi:ferritin-like domain-containing protein [Tepidamorphus sp. 3E244]|uniref:YciE/YciF ferroxidase family protein n=1 Tax=Tepidamorphus sp. 3E244 TaxID=3385498 RepID=UPI0038FC8112
MKTLADAFEHTLKDIYYAENAITKALPKVIKKVSHKQLKEGLKEHLEETKDQIKKLDEVFKSLGKKPSGEKCDAIEGLIKETDSVLEEAEGDEALHAAVIGCCQAIEHYEIARYGTLREWADVLGKNKAHDLLTEILDQEKAANSKLTHMAVSSVNEAA